MSALKNKITLNTVYICGGGIFENAMKISDIVYADKSPDSVILSNGDLRQDAFIVTPLIHFPRNAPILFPHMGSIDQNTVNRMFKLKSRR